MFPGDMVYHVDRDLIWKTGLEPAPTSQIQASLEATATRDSASDDIGHKNSTVYLALEQALLGCWISSYETYLEWNLICLRAYICPMPGLQSCAGIVTRDEPPSVW